MFKDAKSVRFDDIERHLNTARADAWKAREKGISDAERHQLLVHAFVDAIGVMLSLAGKVELLDAKIDTSIIIATELRDAIQHVVDRRPRLDNRQQLRLIERFVEKMTEQGLTFEKKTQRKSVEKKTEQKTTSDKAKRRQPTAEKTPRRKKPQ